MAKIRTKNKINWGGINPFILNKIEIELTELIKNDSYIIFSIKDSVIAESENEEIILQTIREKNITISKEIYNSLYNSVLVENPNLTPFEQSEMIPKLAFLKYFKADKLENGKCGYNTEENEWEIV